MVRQEILDSERIENHPLAICDFVGQRPWMKIKHSPETLAKIAGDLERAAYKRGWNEAVAEMASHMAKVFASAGLAKPPEADETATTKVPKVRKRRGGHKRTARRGSSRKIVADAIRNNPGKTGTEIALMVGDRVNKHTVRTQLRKLKLNNEIEQHDMRWYIRGAHWQAA